MLGSSTTSFPDLQKQVANLPVIELVNAIDAPHVKSRVGVPWFQMGYQPGRYLVQWAHGKPLNVLWMPGPDNAGGSKEMVEGFREMCIRDSRNRVSFNFNFDALKQY